MRDPDPENVRSREDLAAFVSALRHHLESNEPDWENPTLDRYLEALAAWITDSPSYFKNRGDPVPSEPTWALVAGMLYAAGFYE